jgi:hypothetical protein
MLIDEQERSPHPDFCGGKMRLSADWIVVSVLVTTAVVFLAHGVFGILMPAKAIVRFLLHDDTARSTNRPEFLVFCH